MSAEDPGGRGPPADPTEQAQRGKDEFVSLLAHELKTPLTPLKALAQLVRSRLRRAREGTRPLDLEALERSAATIERQVDRMDRLVTDLLDVSRIARGRAFEMRSEPFDLTAAAAKVVGRWRETTQEAGRHSIEIESPEELRIAGDRDRIEQVLSALIDNAVKFMPSGGAVLVRVEAGGGVATVTVGDDGIGIDADAVGIVGREPFVRARRSAGYAGLGLGLYLCRLIAEGHGGRLEVESEGEDRGTKATLTLPLRGASRSAG